MTATKLYGSRFIGGEDPVNTYGAVPFGFQWADTDNDILYERNAGGTAWVTAGLLGTANYGHVQIIGDALQGPLTGATGLAQLSGADFSNFLKISGLSVATQADLASQILALKTNIQQVVTAALLGQSTLSNLNAKIAMFNGTSGTTPDATHYWTIPTGTANTDFKYADGSYPTQAETFVIVSPATWVGIPDNTVSSAAGPCTLFLQQKTGDRFSWTCYGVYSPSGGGTVNIPGTFNYFMLAFKSS